MEYLSKLALVGFLVPLATFSAEVCADEHRYLAENYLENMSKGDWASLYSCKSNKFKSLVPYDTFVKSMESSAEDYKVVSFDVKQTRVVDDRYIGITFSFTLGDPESGDNILTMEDEQVWEKLSDGSMVCLDLGMRMFFPFNAEHIRQYSPDGGQQK